MNFDNCKYDNLQLADQFLKMAEKFLPYASNPKNELDMYESDIKKNLCGTVACHGGYAALALNLNTKCFLVGAVKLAQYLGFPDDEYLELWAEGHKNIWGSNGEFMFCNDTAFVDSGHATMFNVVEKYLSVAKRLMEIKS